MVKFNWKQLILPLIIIIGLAFLFYGIFQNSDLFSIIFNNFFIILGSAIVIFGILYFIIKKWSFDSKTKMGVIINVLAIVATILAALLGAYLGTSGSEHLLKEQTTLLKQNAAKAFYFDVSAFRDQVSNDIPNYENSINYDECQPILLSEKIYNGNEAYTIYQNEISSFDSNLSLDLYNFYRFLNHAENLRQNVLQRHADIISHNYTVSISDWPISPLNPDRGVLMIPTPMTTLTDYDVEEASYLYPWGTDNHLKFCTLLYYDPNGPNQKNNDIIREITDSMTLKREIITAYNMTPSLLDELNSEIYHTQRS